MIDKMLALASVEYRQVLENTELLALRELLTDAVDTIAPRMAKKQVEFQVDAEPTLPPLRGDRFLLRQAIANLLDNALDFAPAGSIVRIVIEREQAQLVSARQRPRPRRARLRPRAGVRALLFPATARRRAAAAASA